MTQTTEVKTFKDPHKKRRRMAIPFTEAGDSVVTDEVDFYKKDGSIAFRVYLHPETGEPVIVHNPIQEPEAEKELGRRYPAINDTDLEWTYGADYPKGSLAHCEGRLYQITRDIKHARTHPKEIPTVWTDVTDDGVDGFRPIDYMIK